MEYDPANSHKISLQEAVFSDDYLIRPPSDSRQDFGDMEELGVKPDEDTVRRVAKAFERLGQVDNMKLVLTKYQSKWKYLHFNGERVRVRRTDGGIE